MKKISTLYKKDPDDLSKVTNFIDPQNLWVLLGEGIPTRKRDGTACAIIEGEIYRRFDAKLIVAKELKEINYYIDLLSIGSHVSKVSGKKWQDLSFDDIIVEFDIHPITKMKSAILKNNGNIDLRQFKPNNVVLPKKYYKNVPDGAIPCQEPDPITGHWPHWIKCERKNPEDKYHFEAFDKLIEYYSSDCWSDIDKPNRFDGTYELCGPKLQGNPEKLMSHVLIKHGSEILTDCTNFSFNGLKEYLSNPELDIEGIVFHHKDGRMCKIRKCDFGIKR